jgi:hypothetical protein
MCISNNLRLQRYIYEHIITLTSKSEIIDKEHDERVKFPTVIYNALRYK